MARASCYAVKPHNMDIEYAAPIYLSYLPGYQLGSLARFSHVVVVCIFMLDGHSPIRSLGALWLSR